MKRKLLVFGIFFTLSASAFLLGYLLIADQSSLSKTGALIQRFTKNEPDTTRAKNIASAITGRKTATFTVSGIRNGFITGVDKETGDIFEINTEDSTEKLVGLISDKEFSEVEISPRNNAVFYSFYDVNGFRKNTYLNFINGKSLEMTGNFISKVFSAENDALAYFQKAGNTYELYTLNGSSSLNPRKIFSSRVSTANLSWAGPNLLSVVSYNVDGNGQLFLVDNSSKLTKVLDEYYQLEASWSPSGEQLIFSEEMGEGDYKLYYRNNKGVISELNTHTRASKCTWSSDETYVVCALLNRTSARDEFYKVDLKDASPKKVAVPEGVIHTKKLLLDRSGDYLYVLNEVDELIYKITLSN